MNPFSKGFESLSTQDLFYLKTVLLPSTIPSRVGWTPFTGSEEQMKTKVKSFDSWGMVFKKTEKV